MPINLIVNAGLNKFKFDILKNVAKIANLRPKIGQIPLLSLNINWHNSIIFHPIFTFFILNCLVFETYRMVSKSKLYLFSLRFWCLAPFLLRGLAWVKLCAWTQNHPKKVGRVLAFLFNPYLKIKVSKIIGRKKMLKFNFYFQASEYSLILRTS